MKICIVEDLKFKNFFPLVSFIYVSNLRSGCFTLKERVGKIFKEKNIFEMGRNSILKIDKSHISIDFKGEGEVLFLNSRVMFTEKIMSQIKKKSKTNSIFVNQDGEIVGVKISQFSKWNNKNILFDESFFENDFKDFSIQKIEAKFFNYIWDIIQFNFDAIKFDFQFFKKKKKNQIAQLYKFSKYNFWKKNFNWKKCCIRCN